MQVKLVIFTVVEEELLVYIDRDNLPVQVIRERESLDETARHIFQTRIDIPSHETYLEQLYTFSEKEIVVVYYVLVPSHLLAVTTQWIPTGKLSTVSPFDREVIEYAIQRLRWKIEYTNVVYSLLPQTFTLSELQKIYEVILGKRLDKRNFRKKVLSLRLVKSTGNVRKGLVMRPAKVFSFRKRTPVRVRVFV